MKQVEQIVDLVVPEGCDHPEGNNGVIWGFFFFLAGGSGGFVSCFLFFLFGYAFENFDVSRMLVHNACIPLLFLVCTLTFINFLFFYT